MSIKKFKKIPVFVVEDHNNALEYIYKSIGSRHLPLEGNSIIHFDSHPDLMVPKDLPADTVFNKYELFDALSIEDWLLPACYAGHFESVHWIKPIWSNQIPLGTYKVLVGKFNNFIRLYSNIYYFISDGVCVAEGKLENIRKLYLSVSHMTDLNYVQSKTFNKHYVLDVDLDFFSTKNPFIDMFTKGNLYERLKSLFSFDLPNNIQLNTQEEEDEKIENKLLVCDVSKKRAQQLDELNRAFKSLENSNGLENVEKELSQCTVTKVKDIIRCVEEHYLNPDWWVIHSAGLTCDATGLPEHITTEVELLEAFQQFKEFLKALKTPPILITLARSTEDDYCPPEQVDFIQNSVLDIIKSIFGEISIELCYKKK